MSRYLTIIYFAALAALAPFATDLYLPSLPSIEHFFHASISETQLTLALFFIGYALAQLIWGPLSDRYGRKPILLIGLIVFVVSSWACSVSSQIGLLILFRLLEAVGACAGFVLALAMIKDRYKGEEVAGVLNVVMSVMILAPMVAPIIGGWLLTAFEWQANFYFLTVYGVLLGMGWCFISETKAERSKHEKNKIRLTEQYIMHLRNKPFVLVMLATACNFSTMFAFIASSPYIYIKIFHVNPDHFGFYFAINALGLLLGTTTSSYLKKQVSVKCYTVSAILLSLVSALVMLVLLVSGVQSIWVVVVTAFFVTCGVGLLFSELMGIALSRVQAYIGSASSWVGATQFSLAAIVSGVMGVAISTSALPLAVIMIALCLASFTLMKGYFRVLMKMEKGE